MLTREKLRNECRKSINNIIEYGTTDVELFQKQFEINLLKDTDFYNEIVTSVIDSIMKAEFSALKVHKIGHVLVPKKTISDYRNCALIEIYDEIVYLTLVLSIADKIEKERPSIKNNIVHSYRYKNKFKEHLFDNKMNFTSFRSYVSNSIKSGDYNIVIETDISNFYDRLNLHRLESILNSIKSIDNDIIKLINELLLFWANRDSYGIPVGSNASRILAEASLIEVDMFLLDRGVEFCRFVDDYRIFAKDAFTAHSHLALLNTALSREGLFLNTSKTKIREILKIEQNNKEQIDEVENVEVEDEEHENKTIEETSDKIRIPQVIRGYAGIIPTKFRKLTENEIKKYKQFDLCEMLNELLENTIPESIAIIEFIKTIIAQEEYEYFENLPHIIKKFPQLIPYLIDALIKYEDGISRKTISDMEKEFYIWFENEDTPEYILVYLVRFFKDKHYLLKAFRKLSRNSGDYIGRAILDALSNKLTRGDMLEIREYYVRADLWEKRKILELMNETLGAGENRAFFKDIKIHNSDLFIKEIIK